MNVVPCWHFNIILAALTFRAEKITPSTSIACYMKDRYLELKGIEKNYNVIIRNEVKKYFNEPISSESARKVFLEVLLH